MYVEGRGILDFGLGILTSAFKWSTQLVSLLQGQNTICTENSTEFIHQPNKRHLPFVAPLPNLYVSRLFEPCECLRRTLVPPVFVCFVREVFV